MFPSSSSPCEFPGLSAGKEYLLDQVEKQCFPNIKCIAWFLHQFLLFWQLNLVQSCTVICSGSAFCSCYPESFATLYENALNTITRTCYLLRTSLFVWLRMESRFTSSVTQCDHRFCVERHKCLHNIGDTNNCISEDSNGFL